MIERHHRVKPLVDRLEIVVNRHEQPAFTLIVVAERYNNIKDQIDLPLAVHNAEIVHGELFVDAAQHAVHLLAKEVKNVSERKSTDK